jgi:hypothetical protein
MMGDLHFIIRHGLTGFAFILFVIFGMWNSELWIKEGCNIQQYAFQSPELKKNCSTVKITSSIKGSEATVLALATLIGISLQAMHILSKYKSRKLFMDDARKIIAKCALHVMAATPILGLADEDRRYFHRRIKRIADINPDSIYVWLYHLTDDNQLLIEWARRRRSYYYLGVHCCVSAVIGSLIGVATALATATYPLKFHWPEQYYLVLQISLQIVLLLSLAVMIGGALHLAKRMKAEADKMEFMWALGCVYPDFKREVLRN